MVVMEICSKLLYLAPAVLLQLLQSSYVSLCQIHNMNVISHTCKEKGASFSWYRVSGCYLKCYFKASAVICCNFVTCAIDRVVVIPIYAQTLSSPNGDLN